MFIVLLEIVLPLAQACNQIPLSVLKFAVLLEIVLFKEASCNESQTLLSVNVLFVIVILEEAFKVNPSERFPDKVVFEIVPQLKFSIAIHAPLVTVSFIDTFLIVALDQF